MEVSLPHFSEVRSFRLDGAQRILSPEPMLKVVRLGIVKGKRAGSYVGFCESIPSLIDGAQESLVASATHHKFGIRNHHGTIGK